MHCLVKKLLNRFALSKKLVTSLLSPSSGGISGILLPFANVFKMAQYSLGTVFGSLSLLARSSWYFSLEELIAELWIPVLKKKYLNKLVIIKSVKKLKFNFKKCFTLLLGLHSRI